MRTLRKLLIAMGLCVGIGVAVAPQDVRAAVDEITAASFSGGILKIDFKDNVDDDNVRIKIGDETIKSVTTKAGDNSAEISADVLWPKIGGSFNGPTFKLTVSLQGTSGEAKIARDINIDVYSLTVVADHSKVTLMGHNGINPGDISPDTGSQTYYSIFPNAYATFVAEPASGMTWSWWDDGNTDKEQTFNFDGKTHTAKSGKYNNLSFSLDEKSVTIGGTIKARVSYDGTTGTVSDKFTFRSSDSSIASITDGEETKSLSVDVKGEKAGEVQISLMNANLDGTLSKPLSVIDTFKAIEKIGLSKETIAIDNSINLNDFYTVTPSDATAASTKPTWQLTSDGNTKAKLEGDKLTIPSDGAAGDVKLTATINQGDGRGSVSTDITVKVLEKAEYSVSIDRGITVGESFSLAMKEDYISYSVPTNVEGIAWSSEKGLGEVKNNTVYTAKKVGDDLLTAKFYDSSNKVLYTLEHVPLRVYEAPTIEYSDRRLEISMPKKAGDEDNWNGDVTKYQIAVLNSSGKTLGDYVYEFSGTGDQTVSRDDLASIIDDLASDGRFTSATTRVYFQVNPKGVPGVTDVTNEVTVYQITVSGTGIEDRKYYGLKGQEIKIKATTKSGYTFQKWNDDSGAGAERTIEVKKNTDDNKYTATATNSTSSSTARSTSSSTAQSGAVTPTVTPSAGAGTAAGAAGAANGKSNLDNVPKTGEGNAFLWVIMVSVITIIGAASAVYYKMKGAKKVTVSMQDSVRNVNFANPEALMQEKLNRRNDPRNRGRRR